MKISQREARRLRKRVEQLERDERDRRSAYVSSWPGGVNIDSFTIDEASFAKIDTARKLSHAVVVTTDNRLQLRFYALPLPAEKV